MTPEEIIAREAEVIVPTYVRPDVVFTHGVGVELFDAGGNRYLDFCAGIAVNALGHSDPQWVETVADQAGRLVHVSNLYHTAPQVELAARLVDNSFADRVYFCNSGAEANEAALKFARKYARQVHGRDDKVQIVAFSGGFHGRTMGALAVTLREYYQADFRPLMGGVRGADFNDLDSAAAVIDDDVCAVIVEPIQGEGGVRPATPAFLRGLRQLCDAVGALLIFDEVQCGLGRTGHLWAHELYGVTPDIMTLAKPLAGGLPIGATLCTEAVATVMAPGDHASTFAGGPLICAAALTVLDRLGRPDFLAQVRANSAYLLEQLHARLPRAHLKEIRGHGFLIGVEFDQEVKQIVPLAAERGLVVITAGANVIRLVPPLIVTRDQIDAAIETLAACLTTLFDASPG